MFPITIAGLLYNKEISLKKRLGILWSLLDNQVLLLNVIYLIIGIPIVSFFYTNFTIIQPILPYLLVYISLSATLLYIPILFLRRQLIPIPSGWNKQRSLRDILETLYISVKMLTFGFIPYLHAQIMLLIGIKLKKGLITTKKIYY